MANDEVARLYAVLEANLKGFTKGMDQAQKIADRRFGQMEARLAKSEKRFSSGFGGLNNLGNKLLGGAALIGVERFVSHVVDAASKIKDTSEALGVSTDALQEWGVIAGRSGIKQEDLNSSLEKFSKQLGEAQLKGGEFAKLLKGLGVGTSGTTEEAFYKIADAVAATGSQQQKVAIVTQAFGKSAAGLVPILNQGSAALRAQGEELKRTGSIMTADAINKIDDLGDKWEDLKRQLTATGGNVLAGVADEFSSLSDAISSPAFQEGLRNFGKIMADVAITVARIAAAAPDILAIGAGFRFGGPVGGALATGADLGFRAFNRQTGSGTDTIESLQKKLAAAEARASSERGLAAEGARQQAAALRAQLADRQGAFPEKIDVTPRVGRGGIDRSGLLQKDEGQKSIAQTAAAAAQAAAQLTAALDQANVAILEGTLGRFQAIRKQINDNAAAEIAATDQELKAKIAALDEEKLGHAAYIESRTNLEQEAAAKESTIIVQQREKRLQAARDEIQARYEMQRDIDEQRRETIRSQHDYILEVSKGTQDYYKVQQELADEDAALQEQSIRDRLAHELDTFARINEDAKKSGQVWADYEAERSAATEKAKLEIQAIHEQSAATRVRLTEEETHALEYQIQVMDGVRGGLEDVGAAGVRGFKSMKDAAVSFLEQLAEMTLRLYILRPLLEATLGRSGTTGGSFLGDLLGSIGLGGGGSSAPVEIDPTDIPGRASGGPVSAGQLYQVNENGGPEYFKPNVSGTVIPLGTPKLSAPSAGQVEVSVSVHPSGEFDARVERVSGGVVARAAPKIHAAAVGTVRRNLGPMMTETTKRRF